MNIFSDFNTVYSEMKSNYKDDDTAETIARTLIYGLDNKTINESDLDELLFLILEDSLFNSYLFNLETNSLDNKNPEALNEFLDRWEIPSENKILSNISINTTKDFVICGYRVANDHTDLESLRILLLDSKVLDIHVKNEEPVQVIFPTIIEIDFRRKLLHIRLRDIDNIIGTSFDNSTMSGRIENTLKYIGSFKPRISVSEISNFKTSLYELEEHLLSEKRNSSQRKLKEFDDEIERFTEKVCNKFNPPSLDISPKQYISTGVLSVIATTVDMNELGEVIGIRFRNNQNEDGKYAEITIKDSDNKCISTSNLYWLNLSVLQNTRAVEYLKIIPILPNGVAMVNLEFSLNTANVKLLQRGKHDEPESTKPSQEKYDDVLDFIIKFIK